MDTSTVIAILAFLGGGSVLALINWLTTKGRSGVEVAGLKDDQIVKWRDNALRLSSQILDKDVELHDMSMKHLDCMERVRGCDCPE